ncbi:MAG TPA: hypothetical protein VKX17_12370 [Planctomycetota bacterium]|nr:hypothetical protein [Planctomycetota bacterium]
MVDENNVYVADFLNGRICKINPMTQDLVMVAGGGTLGDDGCAATSAAIAAPYGVAIDSDGSVIFTELLGCRVRKVASGSIINLGDTDLDGFSDSIEVAAGSSPTDPTSIPFQTKPDVAVVLDSLTLSLKVNTTSANSDTISLTGGIFYGSKPVFTNQQFIVALGNVAESFTLNKNGDASTKSGKIHMQYNKKKSQINVNINLKKGDFRQFLSNADNYASTQSYTLNAAGITGIVLFANEIHVNNIELFWRVSRSARIIRVNGATISLPGSGFGAIVGR